MYYGMEYSNVLQDIIASFLTSIFATTPSFLIRKMFEYAKPRQDLVQVTKQQSLRAASETPNPAFDGNFARIKHVDGNDTASVRLVSDMRKEFYDWMFPV